LLEKTLISSSIDASQAEHFRADIDRARSLLDEGDAMSDPKEQIRAYARALAIGVSLATYLNAHASFPQANILPTLLQKNSPLP
jgi:hypothetical protein